MAGHDGLGNGAIGGGWQRQPRRHASSCWISVLQLDKLTMPIGGMKRFGILVQRFRNRKENFEDGSVGICAGLWNLNLCY